MIRKIRNKKVLLFWVMVIAVLVLIALFPGLFASHDPVQADLNQKFLKPCKEMPLGADHMGRCILCRMIYGTRVSLFVSGAVVLITAAVGGCVGMFSGFYGGKTDTTCRSSSQRCLLLQIPADAGSTWATGPYLSQSIGTGHGMPAFRRNGTGSFPLSSTVWTVCRA